MQKNNVALQVEKLVLPLVLEQQLELVDVEYVKEGGNWYLRVFIDKPGGVNHTDCEQLSHKLDKLLDEVDPIPQAYYLEVSSPGLERPLKKIDDFIRFKGQKVNITTFAPVAGRKTFTGELGELTEKGVNITMDGRAYVIPMDMLASARLAVEF